ncbi:hypothetical protein QP992_08770 [Corynebacterium ulcerans]|uniref:hypothetical protein n=1 Tax=Corynebacterium ulcerans TaxID=65058 RepID=UPI002550F5B2|nr:hypothetical protein [Corynebacterium ulcerans]MDK8889235.1 hypothetical protein [Corynebacterium ulcerans]
MLFLRCVATATHAAESSPDTTQTTNATGHNGHSCWLPVGNKAASSALDSAARTGNLGDLLCPLSVLKRFLLPAVPTPGHPVVSMRGVDQGVG